MLINCPECGKKNMALSADGISSHVYKSNVHKDMTKAEKLALYRKMIPKKEVGKGSMSRDSENRLKEKSMINGNRGY